MGESLALLPPPSEQKAAIGSEHLDTILTLLDKASEEVAESGRRGQGQDAAQVRDLDSVRAFNNVFWPYRQLGAQAVNNLNMRLASKAEKQNQGSKTRTYVRLDALCDSHDGGGKRVASAIIPLEELRQYVPVGPENFVNLDDLQVKQGISLYLEQHRITPNNMVYSHLEERINKQNMVGCGDHLAEFRPLSIMRMVIDNVTPEQKNETERAIVSQLTAQLTSKSAIRQNGTSLASRAELEGMVADDLRAILNVGQNGYPDLYSAFEQTRFFATILSDITATTHPTGLKALRYFEGAGEPAHNGTNRHRKRRDYGTNGKKEALQKGTLEDLEYIIADRIKVPHEVFEYRIKNPQSFGTKVLLNRLFPVIQAGYRDGTLNAFLREQGLPELEEEPRQRDLRDFFGMAWIVHGDSVTYDNRGYSSPVPELEEIAQSEVYNRFFALAGISADSRNTNANGKNGGSPAWRKLGIVRTSDGITINLASAADVKDYLAHRKPNNFAEIKVYLTCGGLGFEVPLEVQLMTNFMDTRNRLGSDASHETFKQQNAAMIEYGVQRAAMSRQKANATLAVLAAASAMHG